MVVEVVEVERASRPLMEMLGAARSNMLVMYCTSKRKQSVQRRDFKC